MKKSIIIMALLSLIEIALVFYLAEWREVFWSSVVNKNLHVFLVQLSYFGLASAAYVFVYGTFIYTSNLATIQWRKILNNRAYKYEKAAVTNVNQRIQEDCSDYPRLALNLYFGVGRSILYLLIFSIALCTIVGPWILVSLIVYSIIATFIGHRIARPLAKLNYVNQTAEATYRSKLTKSNFKDCIGVMLQLAKQNLKLNYFVSSYGQLSVIFPLVLLIPAYFISGMTFGLLMQVSKIMDVLLENLSYGINSFDSINRLICCRNRLKEIDII